MRKEVGWKLKEVIREGKGRGQCPSEEAGELTGASEELSTEESVLRQWVLLRVQHDKEGTRTDGHQTACPVPLERGVERSRLVADTILMLSS